MRRAASFENDVIVRSDVFSTPEKNPIMRLHLVPNSHIDPVWLWDKREGIDEVLNTFRSACDRMDEFPSLTFAGSSLQFYEWVLRFDPALFKRIQHRVAEGRWEVVGSWWIEADSNLPRAVSFRQHARLARAFERRHFGDTSPVAYLPDSFGHPASLPKLLAETGFKYFLFCRPGAHEKADLPANLFYWEYAGRRVLAYRLKFHYAPFRPLDDEHLRPMLDDEEFRRQPVNAFFFGIGNHGGGPTIAEIEYYNRYLATHPPGDAGYSTCRRFFEEAEKSPGIPTYQGDLHMHAVGCYSVLRALKESERHTEDALERTARALRLVGRSTRGLNALWKPVLFNQFHDILPGSCTPQAEAEAREELGCVASTCRDLTYSALKSQSLTQIVQASCAFSIPCPMPSPDRFSLNPSPTTGRTRLSAARTARRSISKKCSSPSAAPTVAGNSSTLCQRADSKATGSILLHRFRRAPTSPDISGLASRSPTAT